MLITTCNQTLWSLPFRPWLLERWIALFTGYWSLSVTRCSKKPILCYPFDRDLSSECHYQPFEQPGIGTWTHEKLFAHNNVNNLIFPGKAALTYNLTCCTFLIKMWMLCLFLAKFPFFHRWEWMWSWDAQLWCKRSVQQHDWFLYLCLSSGICRKWSVLFWWVNMLIQLNVSRKQGGNFKSMQQVQMKKSKTKQKNKEKQQLSSTKGLYLK